MPEAHLRMVCPRVKTIECDLFRDFWMNARIKTLVTSLKNMLKIKMFSSTNMFFFNETFFECWLF